VRLTWLIFAIPVSAAPSFYQDVSPIFEKHCDTCHRAGEAAPMSLVDYSTARPWAKSIKEAIVTRKMPPWFADPHVGTFSNDARLSEEEIRTIVDWVDAGAVKGTPRKSNVTWTEGWKIGKPDVVFEMPSANEIPLSGTVPYQYAVVPTNFKRDMWVRLAEVRAGDREHTHHIVASIREPGSHEALGQGEFLAGYGPGAVPELLAPGQAKLIKAGSEIVFQLHYTTDGKPGSDRSRVGLIFADKPPRERVVMLAAANVRFEIPPGDPNFKVEARQKLHEDATLVSLLPHMHLRGKTFEFRAAYPTGDSETLLRVPNYDFDWQLSYYLASPKRLPAGSTIEATATYDNSANNPKNPDATKAVRFGDQNWDEMMIGYFEAAIDLKTTLRELLVGPR